MSWTERTSEIEEVSRQSYRRERAREREVSSKHNNMIIALWEMEFPAEISVFD